MDKQSASHFSLIASRQYKPGSPIISNSDTFSFKFSSYFFKNPSNTYPLISKPFISTHSPVISLVIPVCLSVSFIISFLPVYDLIVTICLYISKRLWLNLSQATLAHLIPPQLKHNISAQRK